MKKEFFLKCDCEEDGLAFVKFDNDPELWVSYFRRGHIKESLWEKLKLCYRIIFNQEVNLWDIIISDEKLQELKKFLNRL